MAIQWTKMVMNNISSIGHSVNQGIVGFFERCFKGTKNVPIELGSSNKPLSKSVSMSDIATSFASLESLDSHSPNSVTEQIDSAGGLQNLNSPLNDIIQTDCLNKIKEMKEPEDFSAGSFSFTPDIDIDINEKYNVVRFCVGKGQAMEVVNIWLSKDEYTVKSIETPNGEPPNAALLARLVDAGGIQPSLLKRIGISQHEIELAKENQILADAMAKKLECDDVDNLPSINQYTGKTTQVVCQGEGYFFIPGKATIDGLYTFGAGPCLILIGTSKDHSGNIQKIGLAHIDAVIRGEAIDAFFNKLKTPDGTMEISIISGERETALRVFQASERAGAKIIFAAADFTQHRSDAATVDAQGNIYYGDDYSLNKAVDPKKIEMISMKRQLALGGSVETQLALKNH